MQYEIDFQPDDGRKQTLYADLTQQQADDIQKAIDSKDAADTVLRIPSRVAKNSPTHSWLFRASRISLRKA
ncbi:hypothetical protein GCM10023085_44960 [Actinomadura viridis]|uniref:Uncharacterized protein n=1 Tax=Actinomadura viridis TaxID=58110 RepID=A0A931DNG8_9ACTN|nr:hypothetical protein [Actinomadura viridis]MBG6089858.1 hypothetical protein [Actinomadura viridis]